MTTKQNLEEAGIKYFGSNFTDWFLPMKFNPKSKCVKLQSKKLERVMSDQEIQDEFNPSEVSLEEIAKTLKELDTSTWSIFYAKDKDGVLRTVSVYWCGDGWLAFASALDDYRWFVGGQVFSRNSFAPTTPSVPLSPKHLDSLESRLEKVERILKHHNLHD